MKLALLSAARRLLQVAQTRNRVRFPNGLQIFANSFFGGLSFVIKLSVDKVSTFETWRPDNRRRCEPVFRLTLQSRMLSVFGPVNF